MAFSIRKSSAGLILLIPLVAHAPSPEYRLVPKAWDEQETCVTTPYAYCIHTRWVSEYGWEAV